ncbi:MAG: RNA methyltransferase [Verrucomicrobiota bacterium]
MSDDLLAPYRDLPNTRRSGRIIVEGRWAVEALLQSEFAVESVILEEGLANPPAVPPDITILRLAREEIHSLVGFKFHHGVLACAMRPAPTRFREWLENHDAPDNPTFAVCVNLADASNIGAIVRSAAALGLHAVLIPAEAGADPFSRKSIRASSGAAFRLPVLECVKLADDLGEFRKEASIIASTLEDDAVSIAEMRASEGKRFVLLGSERDGLSRDWLDLATVKARIPVGNGVDSLNVAAAAAIFFFLLR